MYDNVSDGFFVGEVENDSKQIQHLCKCGWLDVNIYTYVYEWTCTNGVYGQMSIDKHTVVYMLKDKIHVFDFF